MARIHALKKLQARLVIRRARLGESLHVDLADLDRNAISMSDDDRALSNGTQDVLAGLAEHEADEIQRISVALGRMKEGRYGVCDGCNKKIPLARLNALPYTTTCVACQREQELNGDDGWFDDTDRWSRVRDPQVDRDIRLADYEVADA